ncbi:MAG TPA: DUF3102 domain-containing protein [Xanthobacteraceae bacterium]|nr:DUF3102 domain-containing protein [Xanthobacteraceae bacterium]
MTKVEQIATRLRALDRASTASTLETGGLLMEAKAMLRETETRFGDWLRAEVRWSQRTAERFMRARKWYDKQLAAIRHAVDSHFEPTALYLISAADPDTVAAVVKLGGTQARISAADVRAIMKPKTKPGPKLSDAVAIICGTNANELDVSELKAGEILTAISKLEAIFDRIRGNVVKLHKVNEF